MIKVFTSVYLLESTTNAFDAMEQVLMQKPFTAEAGDRQAVAARGGAGIRLRVQADSAVRGSDRRADRGDPGAEG